MCEHRSRIALRLLSNVPARELLRAGHGSQAKRWAKTHRMANAAGIGWCRSNSGARAPLAREGLRLVWVCPCVVSRLQKSASVAEAQRSAYPVATGRVDGSQGRDRPRKGQEPVAKASMVCIAVAKPRGRRRPEPGARKGAAGQRPLLYGRHLGPFSHTHRFTRSSGGQPWQHAHRRHQARKRCWTGRGSHDKRCQKRVRTRRERKTTPPAMKEKPEGAVRRSESHWREPGDSPSEARAKARDRAGEPTRHGCSYEDVRWQKSVRRILAPCPFEEPQGESTVRCWLGGAPHGVLTHAAGASLGVRTVCAPA